MWTLISEEAVSDVEHDRVYAHPMLGNCIVHNAVWDGTKWVRENPLRCSGLEVETAEAKTGYQVPVSGPQDWVSWKEFQVYHRIKATLDV